MRLIIELSESEHHDLKIFAAKRKTTMRHIVLEGINTVMGNPNKPIKPIKRERHDQFMDLYKKSGMNETEAASAMDMEEADFMALVNRERPVTGDILLDAELYLTPLD